MTDQEINEAVAKKLGWIGRCEPKCRERCSNCYLDVPAYSTSIKAAWEIVEFVPHDLYVRWFKLQRNSDGYTAGWYRVMGAYEESYGPVAEATADTPAMAIALAFLKLEGK